MHHNNTFEIHFHDPQMQTVDETVTGGKHWSVMSVVGHYTAKLSWKSVFRVTVGFRAWD